jgi:hypothetical protein
LHKYTVTTDDDGVHSLEKND